MAKQQHKLAIQSYGAYALEASVYVRGRILRAERTAESYRFWATFRSNMRRFVSREVSGVPIMLTLGNRKWETHSDREGYYHFEVESSRNGTASPQAFVLDLLEHVADSHQAYIMDLNPRAQVGVISDIDDTLLDTGITSFLKWRIFQNSFFRSPHQRVPMPGIPDVFKKFRDFPVFYVSNSPWNLYEVIKGFFISNGFPEGPIFLRDYGVSPIGNFSTHKESTVLDLMKRTSPLPMIFFGDTASDDVDIYLRAAEQEGSRVKGIFIRETAANANAKRVRLLTARSQFDRVVFFRKTSELKDSRLWRRLMAQIDQGPKIASADR